MNTRHLLPIDLCDNGTSLAKLSDFLRSCAKAASSQLRHRAVWEIDSARMLNGKYLIFTISETSARTCYEFSIILNVATFRSYVTSNGRCT